MEFPIRINKYLSQVGFCSRRQADKLLQNNRILINDKLPELGTKVLENDVVKVDGKPVKPKEDDKVYMIFNKPKGIVCTTDSSVEKNNIVDYINYPTRIYPVGRLDKMSEGLIFMTNDGKIVNKILRARHHHEKEYLVKVNKPVTNTFLNRMQNGVDILDTTTRPCKTSKVNQNTFKIVLTQGLNRQIRRMCEALNYRVIALKRIRIMHIKLDVPVGQYRMFSQEELKALYKQI
ncbi:pseudouridine synthase [Mesohalobacter halotolerans]|uniref:Pseudouridine synthase n=1 Tax=Mesohalobacter halotolerans TaxID=1883405 RepID=A0A4U5TRB7_9FLAO|nr:pseudouridine synthase [Mesohalobacter halotolerans]TKS56790.1 pseudouridine synthase [Mesohalobacter halotolerans]